MSMFAAGKEVLSYCGKCRLSLGHIIVSMKDSSTIGKVKCNTCQSMHAYKDPSTKVKKVKSGSTRRGVASSKNIPVGEFWRDEMSKASGKAKAYSVKDLFLAGDIIDHKTFGPGIVQHLIDDKIEVLFEHELKILVHGK